MDQGAQRATVDHEPGDEGTKLCRRKEVHLKHGDGMRPNRLILEFVDSQLGDCRWDVGGQGYQMEIMKNSGEVHRLADIAYILFLSSPTTLLQTAFS